MKKVRIQKRIKNGKLYHIPQVKTILGWDDIIVGSDDVMQEYTMWCESPDKALQALQNLSLILKKTLILVE
jgi:hypothetical protein